jgi:hypothetical protein
VGAGVAAEAAAGAAVTTRTVDRSAAVIERMGAPMRQKVERPFEAN